MKATPKSIKRSISHAKTSHAKDAMTPQGAKKYRKFIEDLAATVESNSRFTVGGASIGVGMLTSAFLSGGQLESVGVEKETNKRLTGGNAIQLATQFKTKFEYGRRSSQAIRSMAAQNGTVSVNLINTETSTNFNEVDSPGAALNRADLSKSYGFNQKLLLVPGRFLTLSVRRALAIFGLDPQARLNEAFNTQQIYGMCMEERTRTRIMNTSTYFPTIIKYYMVSVEGESKEQPSFHGLLRSIGQAGISTGVADDPNVDPTLTGRIPGIQQFSDIVQDSSANNRVFNTLVVDPETSITGRADFRGAYSVMKTFTKKLMPGDVWELDITRHTGAGWDLSKMAVSSDASTEDGYAVSHYPLIECQGIPCECSKNTGDLTYMGTSPGWIQTQFRTDTKFINKPIQSISNVRGVSPSYAIRAFVKNVASDTGSAVRKFNVSAANIGPPDGPAGNYYIPLVSDKEVKYARPTI